MVQQPFKIVENLQKIGFIKASIKSIMEVEKNEYSAEILIGKMGQGNIDFLPFINSLEKNNKDINKEVHILSDLQEYSFLGIRDKSLEELTQLLDEKQLDAFRIRMAKATGQLGNTHEVRANRRTIAQLQTLINEKQRGDS